MESALIFGGVVVSLIVQYVKTKFAFSTLATMSTVVALSLVGAAGFYYLKAAGLWEAALQIFVTAGAFYSFIIRNVISAPVVGAKN